MSPRGPCRDVSLGWLASQQQRVSCSLFPDSEHSPWPHLWPVTDRRVRPWQCQVCCAVAIQPGSWSFTVWFACGKIWMALSSRGIWAKKRLFLWGWTVCCCKALHFTKGAKLLTMTLSFSLLCILSLATEISLSQVWKLSAWFEMLRESNVGYERFAMPAVACVAEGSVLQQAVLASEDFLCAAGFVPSDFMVLKGRKEVTKLWKTEARSLLSDEDRVL